MEEEGRIRRGDIIYIRMNLSNSCGSILNHDNRPHPYGAPYYISTTMLAQTGENTYHIILLNGNRQFDKFTCSDDGWGIPTKRLEEHIKQEEKELKQERRENDKGDPDKVEFSILHIEKDPELAITTE